ncbi:DUF1259 domain-containing protein [Mesobacillus zeae]|uniref:DUF1259 domain-containing protein n=1 Tax=Mesobacillus zeae TaxID=1917180 RepID=A0A398B1W8_9BACI|nr:DUF1259 domain-containing protein [Mesobacillus zeae]RID81940.1 DUF1259 domain-containing protein [Mesobacillus zeae]
MKKIILISGLLFCVMLLPKPMLAEQNLDCKELEKVFDTKVEAENGTCKVEITRKDLDVIHMGKKLSPETMELVFHFAFENVDGGTAVIGEMALLDDEVSGVVDELRNGKLEISAIHNHHLHEQPKIMYLHFQGIGDKSQQAAVIQKAIETTGYKK